MKIEDKALLVIEAITSDMTMMDLQLHSPEDKLTQELAAKLGAIYRYSHIARKPSCISAHDDWVKQLEKSYKKMHRGGVF